MRSSSCLLALVTLTCTFGCTRDTRHVNPMSASEVARHTSVRVSDDGVRSVLGPAYLENVRLADRVYGTAVRLLAKQSSPRSRRFEFRMVFTIQGMSDFGTHAVFDSSGVRLALEDERTWRSTGGWRRSPHSRRATIIILSSDDLEARVDRGLSVRISGARGEIRLGFPGFYVRAFLEKVHSLTAPQGR